MLDDEETCAAAAAVASVPSTAEEQRAAAERKRRTQWARPLLRSRQKFGAYELLLSELLGSHEQLYAEFTRVLPEDFDFLLTAIAPYVTGSSHFQKPVSPNI